MKPGDLCLPCIEGLIDRTLELIGKKGDDSKEFKMKIRSMWTYSVSPPSLASEILRKIRSDLGVHDPYFEVKKREFEEAKLAFETLKIRYGEDLESSLKLSAMGNSSDYFLDSFIAEKNGSFVMDLERIGWELMRASCVLILGDNVSDFVFDQNFIRYAKRLGKRVYYCVKGGPAQNDLTVEDVKIFGLDRIFENFISTGSDNVGLRPSDIRGELKRLWQADTFILAKGMGNYESITEFSNRPITYVMKVKCEEVSKSVGYPVGTYLAIFKEG